MTEFDPPTNEEWVPERGDGFDLTQTWQKVIVAATITVVALLITSNVLLLQIVRSDNKDQSASVNTKADPSALPALPPASGNGSSRALLNELDRTKRQFKKPLNRTLDELTLISNSTASLGELPVLLQRMVDSVDIFAAAAPELRTVSKQLKSMNKEFKSTSALVVGFGPVLTDLEKTIREIEANTARIRACTEKPTSCS